MPPMYRADKRKSLLPGENTLPFVQSLVLSLARTNYFLRLDFVPVDLALGMIAATATSGYTALIAVRLARGSSGKRLLTWAWFGLVIPIIIDCFCSNEIAGMYYVAVVALNRSSMWAGIVQAIRTREGRYFCDLNMVSRVVISRWYFNGFETFRLLFPSFFLIWLRVSCGCTMQWF